MLDLDETLVHSSLEDPVGQPDFSFTVTFNGRDHCVQVRSLNRDAHQRLTSRACLPCWVA